MGLPTYLDAHCAAQENCMLPQVDSSASYQGISQGASSFDRARNLQGTVNVTKVTSNHTLRGGVDVRQAQRLRSAGGNPSGQLSFNNEFTRQAQRHRSAHAEQPRIEHGGVHARHSQSDRR